VKVLGPIDFQRESAHLMSTVDLAENMRTAMKPPTKKPDKKAVKFHSGGMEIHDSAAHELTDSAAAAHELQESSQMKLNPAVNRKDFLPGERLQTAAKRETRVSA